MIMASSEALVRVFAGRCVCVWSEEWGLLWSCPCFVAGELRGHLKLLMDICLESVGSARCLDLVFSASSFIAVP